MLSNADQVDRACVALAVNFVDQALDGGHVAVLHRDPNGLRVVLGQFLQFTHLFDGGASWFFQQDWNLPQAGDVLDLFSMSKVGAGDDQAIHVIGQDHLVHRSAAFGRRRKAQAELRHVLIGLKDACDHGVVEQRDVAQMFLSHHAAADESVASQCHEVNRWWFVGWHGSKHPSC